MTGWTDLSDSELRRRMIQRGSSPQLVDLLIAHRAEAWAQSAISKVLQVKGAVE